ncbi:MAG: RHS repeat-associated core domain-containing protein, partial [Bacteroidota bacterium]
DHLGTITHLKNGSTIDEYSFDAWGRRRDKDNWSYTLSGEPALFADRGFTGHEFLADFNLYNMNGRLYDPVVGRFLSPDPYIADPSFTQSYNRYSYVLNNPLKYNDPTGEFPWLAAGIFAAYMYLNNAHANRDQSTGKWAWNPTSWFGKGSNTTVVFGVKTNSDFTDATAFMGIGGNPFMPAFAVNSNRGVGFGVNTPQGTDFAYPGAKQPSEQSIANEAIGKARMNSVGSGGGQTNWGLYITGAVLTAEDIYNNFYHNHTTYKTLGGEIKNIYKSNGTVRSARAAQFARTSLAIKTAGNVGTGLMTATAGYNIYTGNSTVLDYGDFSVGTIGLIGVGASYAGYAIPGIGQGVAAYSWSRLWFDLGANYGPSKWYGNDNSKWFK